MSFDRRRFFRTASGAIAFASSYGLLTRVGIAQTNPIRIANILDRTGGINPYCLKQIKATAMAVDELNAKGGLRGRKLEIVFYDSQSNNQLNSQYATQAFARDKVDVLFGGVTSSSREVMRPIVNRFRGLYFYNALYEGGVCDRRHVSTGMVPAQQIEPLVEYVVKEKGAKKGYILAAKPDVVWSALVGDAHMSFYRQYESTIGKKNLMLASTTYGAGRENVALSAAENEGIIIATSFVDMLPTAAAKDFVERFKKFSGENDYIGEYGEYGYRGIMLWAEAVKKAGSVAPDDVIKALGGTKFDGPGGLYTIDGQTNHTVMDIHLAVGNATGGYDLLKSFQQRQPVDTQQVCDLIKNPNDNKQYEPKL